jgi:hypothetical protein
MTTRSVRPVGHAAALVAALLVGRSTTEVGPAGAPRVAESARVVAESVSFASDRGAKQDFSSVEPNDILERLASLRVERWSYKSEPGVRHRPSTAGSRSSKARPWSSVARTRPSARRYPSGTS